MIRKITRWVYLALSWVFVAGILTQVFFAGMGIFAGRSNWETHGGLGHLLGLFPLLMVILVFVGGYPRRTKGMTILLFLVYLFMADFVIFIRQPPQVAALHPVLALILFATAIAVARNARTFVGASTAEPPAAA